MSDQSDLIAKIERARQRREDELLLLLLMLSDEARRDVAVALKHGLPVDGIIANTFARAVPAIAGTMADAHMDAYARFGRITGHDVSRSDAGELAALMALYEPSARQAAQAQTQTLQQALRDGLAKFPDEAPKMLAQSAFDNAGYSRAYSSGLDSGAERAVVAASNFGIYSAARGIGDKLGMEILLRHYSVVDEATTDICLDRDGLTLPATDSYWLRSIPSLHFRCRSIVLPAPAGAEISQWRPTVPVAPGFGYAPAGFLESFIYRAA